jgi:hypothetical protein
MGEHSDEKERCDRLFDAIGGHPDPDELADVVARLRAPATKLDIALALVLQADFNTSLSALLLDLTKGREVHAEQLVHLADLQRRFGYEMFAVLESLVPDEQA